MTDIELEDCMANDTFVENIYIYFFLYDLIIELRNVIFDESCSLKMYLHCIGLRNVIFDESCSLNKYLHWSTLLKLFLFYFILFYN